MTLNTPRGATERRGEEGGELDKFAINIIYILTKANCCDLHNNLTGRITIWPIDFGLSVDMGNITPSSPSSHLFAVPTKLIVSQPRQRQHKP